MGELKAMTGTVSQALNAMRNKSISKRLFPLFGNFLNDSGTFKDIVFGAGTTPITLSGAFTTGISIEADGTTAIAVTSAFTGTTGFSFAGTATDGIAISGACVDAIHISGTNTASGLHISGDQVQSILIDVDAAVTDAIYIGVDDSITATVGLNIDRTGTTGVCTTAIRIDTDGTTGLDITSGFSGTTMISLAGTATDGINVSGVCGDAIEISGAATVNGLNVSADCVTGITISGQTTMGLALAVAAAGGGVSIDAGTANHAADGSILNINVDVEGQYSVNGINVNLDFETTGMGAADASAAFNADINELLVHTDGAGLYGTSVTLTGFATGRADLVGHLVTLDGSKTGGDTSAGIKVISTQTINDSGEDLYGLWTDFSGITLTDGNVYGAYLDTSFTNGSTAYGLYVAMGGGIGSDAAISLNGTTDSGLIINAVCTTAINVAAVQTDETGLDASAVFQHGTYNTALAYGTQADDFLILKNMHITGAATGTYIFGDVNRIDTSAASTGYIHVGYNYLSVGHDLANGYATRSRLAITDDCELGEQVSCLATMEVGAHAITGSGDLRAGLFELSIASGATIATEAHCVEIRPLVAANVAGVTSGIRVNVDCSSPNYVDFGIDIRSMSSQQTAAMRILATPNADALPVGIHIEGQSSTTSVITHAVSLVGTITNALHFDETDGSQAACTVGAYNSGYDETPIACFKVDMNGTAGYVYIHDTVIGVT